MIGLGRYNLLLKLGQGGMGAVFLARQKTLRRYCAVKVITPQLAQDKDAAERFLREARATASLNHPNLVNVFDCDQYDGQLFIAMEYIEGLTLGEILRKHGPMPLALALYWLKQAAAGLDYVHNKNIVHRDIKPDNMIVDTNGVLKIMDLGLAKDRIEADQGMTVTGMVMGSPQYMSPEQIHDAKTADYRTDYYSLGISFYQMLVGTVPFRQTSAASVCIAHLQEAIPSLGFPDSTLNEAMDAFIAKLAAKQKEDRFQSGAELIQTIDSWIASYPFDQAAQEYFGAIPYAEKQVASLLQKEGVQESEVDQDLEPAVKEADETTGTVVLPATNPTPYTVAPPSPPPRSPIFTYLKWAAALVVGLVCLGIGKKLSKDYGIQQPPPEPVAAVEVDTPQPIAAPPPAPTPAPAPTPEPIPEAPKVGSMLIRTKPEKAQVVFGSKTGITPVSFGDLPVGEHHIVVSLAGYRDFTKAIEVEAGRPTIVDITLARIPGKVQLESNPSGAEVWVGTQLVGKTPCEVGGWDGDDVESLLKLEGYQDKPVKTTLTEAGRIQSVTLDRKPELQPVAHQPPPFHDPNYPRGPGNAMQGAQMLMNMRGGLMNLLDTAQTTKARTTSEWKTSKESLLKDYRDRMTQTGRVETTKLNKASDEIGKILDSANRLPDREYSKKRDQMVMQMMKHTMEALGMTDGNSGRGPSR
jgi:serine/threonine protein kinase